MTDEKPVACKACGGDLSNHLGIIGTCSRLMRLARATAQMRVFQRDYFRSRSKEILGQAKDAERKVDALLSDIVGSDVEQF